MQQVKIKGYEAGLLFFFLFFSACETKWQKNSKKKMEKKNQSSLHLKNKHFPSNFPAFFSLKPQEL